MAKSDAPADVVRYESPTMAPTTQPPTPSIRLLFSHCTRRDLFSLLLPAILVSLAAGAVAPFMTYVIGQAFNAFATFPTTSTPSHEDKHALMHTISIVALELLGLAAGALLLSGIMSSLWLWVGERIVMRVRHRVFAAVTSREMEWFDLLGQVKSDEESESVGAGGLMAKFTRDTDDVRMATSLNSGLLIQYITTFITALILAFIRSWSLTLVILSAIPVMVIVQGLSQSFSVPNYNAERSHTASAATLIDRAVASIATVKAFNAQARESSAVGLFLDTAQAAYHRCSAIWGLAGGVTQFILFAMFVQGFWYGAKLTHSGKISAGDVMTVFWACLIASSNLQMCMPLLVVLTKGQSAMVSLELIIQPSAPHDPFEQTPPPYQEDQHSIPLATTPYAPTPLITPSRCLGTFDIKNVNFSYASRPDVRVLSLTSSIHVSGNDLTFIVGGSGSGKSTLAQLLMRMYEPTSGTIYFDEQDMRTLHPDFLREHIALVSQECILFDMSVHDNVAIGMAGSLSGKRPEDVTREEVANACRVAMVHEFVRDLPDGYDTLLGNGGSNLSGGQRQRIALARAVLRNPTVLILDEATSALDTTSRVLVFEAIKQHRRRQTTVVITHDLSQITAEDYLYFMRDGTVVEEGYREELEKLTTGEFRKTVEKQSQIGGFPVKESVDPYESSRREADDAVDRVMSIFPSAPTHARASLAWAARHSIIGAPLSTSTATGRHPWEVDAMQDIMGPSHPPPLALPKKHLAPTRLRGRYQSSSTRPTSLYLSPSEGSSSYPLPELDEYDMPTTPTFNASTTSLPSPSANQTHFNIPALISRRSMTFEPSHYPSSERRPSLTPTVSDDESFVAEKEAMESSAQYVTSRRAKFPGSPRHLEWTQSSITIDTVGGKEEPSPENPPLPSLYSLMRQYYWTVPQRGRILLGLVVSVLNGALTPIFSFLLARLLALVGSPTIHSSHSLTFWALLVLLVAFGDGIANGLKFYLLENASMAWVTSLRKRCFALILNQDKAWFDDSEHSAERMVQVLIKDGDDARTLIATVIGQTLVVSTMVLVGLIWALVQGWQLTLVGVAIGPVFAVAMVVQTVVTSKFEVKNKRAREDVAKRYYEAISNVRAIRSMALESVFARHFDESLDVAMRTGVQGAFVAGFGYGIANSLIYLAEALLFYVGAVFMARGTYSYLRLLEVLNLVVFSVSIAAQMLTFIPKVAKAKQAAVDFGTILALDSKITKESRGTFEATISGDIVFDDVYFTYETRLDAPVLNGLSCVIREDECVAIVGASGSGKSTMGSLLQRLYEPTAGRISINGNLLSDINPAWLRDHVSVVSQTPALFDMSFAENIAYGSDPETVSMKEVERAARDAHIHDFIISLPDGYDTVIGEKAALLSGGQAQRLQIARALFNGRAKVLIFDECTSALDSANQEAVMRTIMDVKRGRTSLLITHKLDVMRMCNRILVVSDGHIVEEGSYEQLMGRRGTFFKLARAGEWSNVQ